MYEPDLVVKKKGRPVVVIEAKSSPITTPSLREAATEQLRVYATDVSSPWSVMADPGTTEIFKTIDMSRPVARLPTGEVVASVGIPPSEVVGRRTLRMALNRWLSSLNRETAVVAGHPELSEFAEAVRDGVVSEGGQ